MKSDLPLENLNPQQRLAIEADDGPILILAGAGSGKTKTLTYRIAYLIETKNISPLNILAVTFTNKAANEMKERIKLLIGSKIHSKGIIPFIGTFHSICVRILRERGDRLGIKRGFNIYDTQDQLEVVKKSLKSLNLNPKDLNPYAVLALISAAKNNLIDEKTYPQFAQGYFQEKVSSIYPIYQKTLTDSNALDFDDLISKTVELLNDKDILNIYQDRFKYIMVDEYQDTNHAQYVLIKRLAAKYQNIYAVGDPDQNIYSFRGATIANILTFEKDYPNAQIIKLEQNYRSTKTILAAAQSIISKNTQRKEKTLWTENEEGVSITIYQAYDEKDEAFKIINSIENKGSSKFNQTAILYRTNAQSRIFEETLLSFKIPYKLVGGTRFYERKEIKDILAYLRIMINPKDSISLERIINVPTRKIGGKSLQNIYNIASSFDLTPGEYLKDIAVGGETSTQIKKFASLYKDLTNEPLNATGSIKKVLKLTNYINWLNDGTEEGLSRVENIEELLNVAKSYDELDIDESLATFLEDVSLIDQEQRELESDNNQFVTLMSLHAAKGLEFNYVYIAGLEEGLFPHSRSFSDMAQMEEERRLCYVGITRAKKELYLSYALQRTIFGSQRGSIPSRFLSDIPSELITFS